MIKAQGGFLTMDFMFALVIVVGFSIILFAVTFTFSIVEITQYITFSSARAYYAAHFTIDDQVQMGTQKFNDLIQSRAFKPLFRPGGWFELQFDGAPVGDYNQDFEEKNVQSYSGGYSYFGSRVRLIAKIMELKFPIIGSTSSTPGSFSAKVASYISREPTEQECRDFESQRFRQILALPSSNYSSQITDDKNYVPIMDNGC